MSGPISRRNETGLGRAVVLLFVISTVFSLLFLERSLAGGDQLNLLARGWLLATQGEVVPYGNPASGGGTSPGSATSVVVGLPLLVWRDARAPVVLILLSHLLAFVLLDRLVSRSWGPRARLGFALLFGLSPLRLYLSGLLWNPSYLLLVAALHAWTARRQRQQGRAFDSFLHVLSLGIGCQWHLSTVILCAASLVLWRRSVMRIHWGGAIAGAAATGLTLLPYLAAWLAGQVTAPASEGFVARGLLYVFPLAHGLWNGVRVASLSLPARLTQFDFTAVVGLAGNAVLAPVALLLAKGVAALTLLAPLAAAYRWLRQRRRLASRGARATPRTPREWLREYVVCTWIGALFIFCLAPTTPMWWQSVVMLPVCLLPVVWLGVTLLRSRARAWTRRITFSWALLSVLLSFALAFGSPHLRCGGKGAINLQLHERYPMLGELGVERRCRFPIVRGSWYPDLFPPRTEVPPATPLAP